MQPTIFQIAAPALRRAVVLSVALHVLLVGIGTLVFDGNTPARTELVDIEVAPPPPEVEALPPEVARKLDEAMAAVAAANEALTSPATPPPSSDDGYAVDAGVPDAPPPDAAPIDAPIDAPPRKKPKPDAAEPMVALADAGVDDAGDDDAMVAAADDGGVGDAGVDDAVAVAILDDAGTTDATEVAMAGSGAGSGADLAGSGAGLGSNALSATPGPSTEQGAGSGSAGLTNEPAVDGAPTTAGTAANLLTYFPPGHVVTALIRFDRLRGTEWQAQTERLLRPMPDYQALFGGADTQLGDKLDTLVISTPSPKDASATTLVARTKLDRADLRAFLEATAPVTWSAAKGGLLGKRTRTFRGDQRVFLSPFRGWFLLAQPADLGTLTGPGAGDLDTVEAKGKLPVWLGGIRAIEKESGDPRGPALVVTLGLGGERIDLEDDFGLGVTSVPTPDRVSLAMELVKQGWLVRGNMSFKTPKEAEELVTLVEGVKQRVADSRAIQLVIGKPLARVVANLSFSRTGHRVSYATSISVADARAILSMIAQQLDGYFRATP